MGHGLGLGAIQPGTRSRSYGRAVPVSLLALLGPLPLHPPEPRPFSSATLVLPFSSTYISLAGMSGWWSPSPMPAPSCQGGWAGNVSFLASMLGSGGYLGRSFPEGRRKLWGSQKVGQSLAPQAKPQLGLWEGCRKVSGITFSFLLHL